MQPSSGFVVVQGFVGGDEEFGRFKAAMQHCNNQLDNISTHTGDCDALGMRLICAQRAKPSSWRVPHAHMGRCFKDERVQ